jgi:NADH-ubiquinone oxidoreductase chain 5
MNRVGDLGLSIGMILWLITYQDSTFVLLFPNIHQDFYHIIGLFLFIGALAKSAQLGLHTWLTSAMEGPTPVSAL